MVLQLEIEALREEVAQTRADRERAVVVARAQRFLDQTVGAAGERDEAVGAAGEIVEPRARIALAPAQLRERDQLAQVGIAARVLDQQHDAGRVRGHLARRPGRAAGPDRFRVRCFERQLGATDRRQLLLLGRFGEPDRAVETVAVGERHPGQARRHGRPDEFFGVRGPLEKREVRPGVEFGVPWGEGHGLP